MRMAASGTDHRERRDLTTFSSDPIVALTLQESYEPCEGSRCKEHTQEHDDTSHVGKPKGVQRCAGKERTHLSTHAALRACGAIRRTRKEAVTDRMKICCYALCYVCAPASCACCRKRSNVT